jgi:all-trans-nonaprenyl-diphosphate synthase
MQTCGFTGIMQETSTAAVAPSADLAFFLEPIKEELERTEKALLSNIIDDSSFIDDLLAQVFKAGGKRIRPALCLLAAKASGAKPPIEERQIILAVLTELIHTASLVHDDVLDEASLRRGQPTVNNKWSDKLAVLVGDLLFAEASVCLSRLRSPEIVGIYGRVLGDLCAGELRQMRQQFVIDSDFETYIQKSIWKTASLFSAGTQSAPILNDCAPEVVARMKSYGLNLGICFQIVDDLLDYTSSAERLGKPAGGDLAQGVITAPALFILQRNDSAATQLTNIIKSRAVSKPEGLAEALAIIRQYGGIASTAELAKEYAAKAKSDLSVLPPSVCRDALEGLTDWLVMRTN